MRFYFTEEDHPTDARGRDIRAALVHAHHRVVHGRLGCPAPAGTDVWMHGIAVIGGPPMDDGIARLLVESSAQIVIFQLCDAESMCFHRIAPTVLDRAQLFLRNHWPSDRSTIPEAVRDRLGWLPPMLKPMKLRPGMNLADRSGATIFYGTRTGLANLADGKNAREQTVRLMRASGLPFEGGIVPHDHPLYGTDPDLIVAKVSAKQHARLLAEAKLCLAPWGNHSLTYRLFEGLAARCLVLAQSIRKTTFINGGFEPGRHYVEVAADLGDLTDKARYYLQHLDEAQRIADAGHRHFKQHFASRGPLVSKYIFDETVSSWGKLYRPSSQSGIRSVSRSLAAQWFPSRF